VGSGAGLDYVEKLKFCSDVTLKFQVFFTFVLVGGEWLASRPGRFFEKERTPRYPLDRTLGGPQSRSERYGKVAILFCYHS
jgi:hypothetical protein